MLQLLLMLSGLFYLALCVFSIVTGIIYMSGKRKLNPLELSDKLLKKIKYKDKFAKKMGLVTFIVGIVQGITAIVILFDYFYYLSSFTWYNGPHTPYLPIEIAVGFTIFSFISAFSKLWNKWSKFAFTKLICYSIILIVLILSFYAK